MIKREMWRKKIKLCDYILFSILFTKKYNLLKYTNVIVLLIYFVSQPIQQEVCMPLELAQKNLPLFR